MSDAPVMETFTIPIDQIQVEKDFNPRTEFEVKELEQLTNSIKAHGILQPLRVRQNGDGVYWLVAGERRLRAARGVLTHVPCIVTQTNAEDQGVHLVEALVENLLREDISIADEVKGYAQLKDKHGWNAKRIAHETGLPQARITQRMQLLSLPDDAIAAAAAMPVKARRVLVKLAEHSPELAGTIANGMNERTTLDFAEEPARALSYAFQLSKQFPVLVEGFQYPASYFAFEGASKELYDQARAKTDFEIYLTIDSVAIKRANQLGAKVELPDASIVLGWEVINHLAGELLERKLKEREEFSSSEAYRDTGAPSSKVVTDPETGKVVDDEDEKKRIRKARFAEAQKEKEEALAFNDALAAPLLNKLASAEFTAPVARLVSRLLLAERGLDYVMRGFRYLHPTGRTTDGRVTKYADRAQSHTLMNDWIQSPRKADEILGRTLVLLVAAQYADERATAMSNRGGLTPHGGGMGAIADGSQTVPEELEKLLKKCVPTTLFEQAVERASQLARDSSYGYDSGPDLDADPGPEGDPESGPQED